MNTLAIDIGNTRVKTELWNDDGFMGSLGGEDINAEKIEETISKYSIRGIIVASVRRDFKDILEPLGNHRDCSTVVFNQQEINRFYKGINHYKGNIGVDRFAAFLGTKCYNGVSSNLIIDAGTALTTDISHNGNFIGGNISLGITTRLKAIHHYTSMLPEIDDPFTHHVFGEDTQSAIKAGVLSGIKGELKLVVENAKRLYNINNIFITGGEAKVVKAIMGDDYRNCITDQFLVTRGLDYHLRRYYVQRENYPF